MEVTLTGGRADTRSLYRVNTTAKTITAFTAVPGGIQIADTGTVVKVGDIFRAETGTLQYQELAVTSVAADGNSFTIGTTTKPAVGDTYYDLRPVSARVGTDGGIAVAASPTSFIKNGSTVTVNQDTTTPANSIPLPVTVYNAAGSQVDTATAALQTAGNTSLASIDTKTPALQSGNVPVLLTSAQLSTLTPLTSVAVSNFPTTQTVSVSNFPAPVTSVSVSNFPATQAISAASLPLPTGAATSANQSTEITALQQIVTNTGNVPTVGQKTMSASQPVAIASDQSAIPVTFTAATPVSVTGSAAAVNAFPVPSTNVAGNGAVAVQLSGTFVAVTTFQGSNDNTNWYNVCASTPTTQAAVPQSAASAAGLYIIPVTFIYFRAMVTSYTSGTVAGIMSVIPTGVQDTAARSVTITSPATIVTNQSGTAFASAPVYMSYATTNVLTTAYVTLIASTLGTSSTIDIFDSSGQAMILATGAAGSEVAQYYVPPGGDVFKLAIAVSTRISIKALTANATSGYILLNTLR